MYLILFSINVLLSIAALMSLTYTSKSDENKMRQLRFFLNVKPIVYIPCIISFAFFLSRYKLRLLSLLIPTYILLLILLDASIFYKIAKELRNGEISFKDYIASTFLDTMVIIFPLFLVVIINTFLFNTNISLLYVIVSVVIIYNLGLPYILKIKYKGCKRETMIAIKGLNVEHYRLFIYDGKNSKEANAIACGVVPPYHIYLSDYLADNLTDNELESVLLHEVGHIKKHHFWVKNLYLAGLYPLMSFVGSIMDLYFSDIDIVVGIAIMFGTLVLFGAVIFLIISRNQEYSADRFVIMTMRNKETFISALNKIQTLNMSANKLNKGEELLSTHPSFNKRVESIKKINI